MREVGREHDAVDADVVAPSTATRPYCTLK
jgi:hypothetical protein